MLPIIFRFPLYHKFIFELHWDGWMSIWYRFIWGWLSVEYDMLVLWDLNENIISLTRLIITVYWAWLSLDTQLAVVCWHNNGKITPNYWDCEDAAVEAHHPYPTTSFTSWLHFKSAIESVCKLQSTGKGCSFFCLTLAVSLDSEKKMLIFHSSLCLRQLLAIPSRLAPYLLMLAWLLTNH